MTDIIDMLPDISPDETIRQSDEVADRIWPMFQSYHPAAIGTALSNLVATWLINFQDTSARPRNNARTFCASTLR